MLKILYFGNMTYEKRKYFSAMEALVPKLDEFFQVKAASKHENILLKMIDFIIVFFKYGISADKVIIDVYSTKYIYGISVIVLFCKIFKKKYILVLHGGNLPNRNEKSPLLIKFLFNKALAIVAPSQYLKVYFESKNYKVHYIPNIVEFTNYKFKTRNKVEPKILNIRGLSEIYNPQLAIKIIGLLKNDFPKIEMVMLGNESEGNLDELNILISQLGLENNVRILGKKTREEWIEIAKNYDIMLSCPKIDNSPVSIIEGMALGLIIVSSNVGGMPFLVNNKIDGFLVEDYNEFQFAKSLKTFFTDQIDLKYIQLNARKKAESFSWNSIKLQWVNLLNS
jgi:glycosyltransferase involved in cell wall biosynthesis